MTSEIPTHLATGALQISPKFSWAHAPMRAIGGGGFFERREIAVPTQPVIMQVVWIPLTSLHTSPLRRRASSSVTVDANAAQVATVIGVAEACVYWTLTWSDLPHPLRYIAPFGPKTIS